MDSGFFSKLLASNLRQLMNMVPFKYAELCNTGKRWYVYFYATNPETQCLQRVRHYINSQKTLVLRKRLAQKMITIINTKLDQGWNPFVSESQKKMFVQLEKALRDALAFKAKYIRARSLPNYTTRINKIITWLEVTGRKEIRCGEFTETNAQDFMRWILTHDNINPTTYNNALVDYRSFWNYLVKTKHCSVNVFRSIDRLPEQAKRKRPFTPDEQIKYRNWLEKNDRDFLVTSLLCYFCGLRPNEITLLRIRDINFQRQVINVDPSISKNKKQRIIPVATKFWPILESFVKGHPDNYFIVSRKFRPGNFRINPIRIAERFREIADVLGFGPELKFYSLKDTCADMLDQSGVSTKTIRDLFGHSSVAVTDSYMKSINSRALDQLRQAFPDFGNSE